MKIEDLELVKRIFEGALMAAERPLQRRDLTALFDDLEKPADDLIDQALLDLDSDCEARGYELKRVSSGYRYQVKQDLSRWVNKLWQERAPRYSRALLETMSLVAYRQPITRGEIEQIRGVAVSTQIIKTLLEREWIKSVGYRDAPGRPAIYATTRQFLDYFNLKSLDQLPPLAEIRDLNTISRELNIELPVEEIKPANDENIDGEANTEDAQAIDSNLESSNPESAELEGAELEGAELEGTDLESADIAETIEASNQEVAHQETGNSASSEVDAFESWIDDELTEDDDAAASSQSSDQNELEMQAANQAAGELKL